ncbi:MAG: YidC/Oxa1 family membrane protein insertase [Patescibacteria group bacterium]|nr:YidC/Oxa1 family membrane protein insertase [Patescibacteria group bacterium]
MFYNTIAFGDLGVAIIFLTVFIRIVLYPFFQKSVRNQTILQRIQPKIKKIQEEHKKDKEKQAKALLLLYKEHKVNPFSGFLFLLIQLPILIILYDLFLKGLNVASFSDLYSFVAAPRNFQTTFLGLLNLQNRSILLVVLAATAQFFQGRLALPKSDKSKPPSSAEQISRQMVFIAPLITIFIFFNFPAAVSLYWLTSSVFSIGQQIIINKQINGEFGNNN